MKYWRRYRNNQTISWITMVVVLLYALLPYGKCACIDCGCCGNSTTRNTSLENDSDTQAEPQMNRSCCCKKSAAEKPVETAILKESDAKKCCRVISEGSDSACVCADAKENFFSSSDSHRFAFEHLKKQFPTLVLWKSFQDSPGTYFSASTSFWTFDNPMSRLPVRLHLLLLVILN